MTPRGDKVREERRCNHKKLEFSRGICEEEASSQLAQQTTQGNVFSLSHREQTGEVGLF